jgi:CheY-like chemotaxis protein
MRKTQSADNHATILVVDDESDTRDLYAEQLDGQYTVKTAASGQEALDIIDDRVAVVLLDRRMPGLSGDDVLHAIRERGHRCRIVLVTGVSPDMDILDLPFDEYLVKPVSATQLNQTVSQMLLRNESDETIQNALALVSKMATLESKMNLSELQASSKYAALESQLSDLRAGLELGETDDEYTEYTTEKIEVIFG